MLTVAEVIVRQLQAAGVRNVYGLPGGEIVHVLDALRRRELPFQLVHHEASAVYMADATARLSGGIGVCITTLGPGAANAVVGAAHAFLDRSPVLILTAAVDDATLPDRPHQHIDLQRLFSPVTKASAALIPTGAVETLEQALTMMQTGRPGPVHLSMSLQASMAEVLPGEPALHTASEPDRPNNDDRLSAAADMLRAAKRPLIVAGLGLEPEAPYDQLKALAEAASAPVVVTPKAKGALSDRHPLSAGVIGLTNGDPAYALLDEADLILAVGLDVVELVRNWQQKAPLIWLAPWLNRDPILSAEIELVGEMRLTLSSLANRLSEGLDDFKAPGPSGAQWGAERVRKARSDEMAWLDRPGKGDLLTPGEVLTGLRRAMPSEAIVTTDVGSHKILAGLSWPMSLPNRYLVANGLSPMGFGLPASIAAADIFPDTPILCLIGDGGLAMSLGELALLAGLQSPVLVVVLRDDALDLIRSHQRRAGYESFGTEFQGPDWVAVGRAYGLTSQRAESVPEVEELVARAIETSRPFLLEVPIDPTTYPTTPVS